MLFMKPTTSSIIVGNHIILSKDKEVTRFDGVPFNVAKGSKVLVLDRVSDNLFQISVKAPYANTQVVATIDMSQGDFGHLTEHDPEDEPVPAQTVDTGDTFKVSKTKAGLENELAEVLNELMLEDEWIVATDDTGQVVLECQMVSLPSDDYIQGVIELLGPSFNAHWDGKVIRFKPEEKLSSVKAMENFMDDSLIKEATHRIDPYGTSEHPTFRLVDTHDDEIYIDEEFATEDEAFGYADERGIIVVPKPIESRVEDLLK